MNIEVVGRHALLFDDDATAAFVNSNDALVEWNSLLIDRYDVRHLLSTPPPSRRRRNLQQTHPSSFASSVSSLESEIDHERYLDLPSPSEEQESDESAKPVDADGYNAVAFSYNNTGEFNDQKNTESGVGFHGFRPPFPVPENLLQSIPPTEKVHQIIARTAMFVRKHGGQSEIVLRVKQGDNPTFGFLMPDHHLYAYFRFLVDHQELLQSDVDGNPQNKEKISDTEHGVGGGALSMLGSLYGSGEDEDGVALNASESKENVSEEKNIDTSAAVFHSSKKPESPVNTAVKDEAVSKHLLPFKEKAPALRKNYFNSAFKAESTSSTIKGESSGLLSAAPDKLQASSLPAMSKIEPVILEPPSDLMRLVDKIVEFIMRNGKQFEAVLVEQDSGHGRFPFLLPSNHYHPYYLKVLQKAQESKLTGKSFIKEKDDLVGHVLDKKTYLSKESDALTVGSAGCDVPYDSDKKEKFKMVIGKTKKDGQDPSSRATQQQFGVGVDAAAAAAILQAATRGIRNPNLGILSNTSLTGNSHGRSSEGGQASSLGTRLPSQPEGVVQKTEQNGEHIVSVPVVKAIAKAAALEAASEADSSEAHFTREQKLKAERLKRAKMFVAMLKSGAAPLETEHLRGLSVEPQESGFSGSGAAVNVAAKEREGSSAPLDIDTSGKNRKSERKHSGDEYNERRLRRKYRSRSSRHEEEEEEEDEEEKKEHKPSRKKHRSHRSSLEDDNEEEKDDVERDDKRSRKKHRLHRSSLEDDEEQKDEHERDHKYSRKKHRSRRSSHQSRDGHKHRKRHSSSKDRESRHRRKHNSSSDDERWHHSKSDKHRKGSESEREELEEGEISSKISDQSRGSVGGGDASREASLDLLSSYHDGRAPSQPSEITEVSDDLRAKIRAMLKATL